MIKLKIEAKKDSPPDFPKIMLFKGHEPESGLLVYFIEDDRGFVLQDKYKTYEVGEYNDRWDMSDFEYFHGSVTLEQD